MSEIGIGDDHVQDVEFLADYPGEEDWVGVLVHVMGSG